MNGESLFISYWDLIQLLEGGAAAPARAKASKGRQDQKSGAREIEAFESAAADILVMLASGKLEAYGSREHHWADVAPIPALDLIDIDIDPLWDDGEAAIYRREKCQIEYGPDGSRSLLGPPPGMGKILWVNLRFRRENALKCWPEFATSAQRPRRRSRRRAYFRHLGALFRGMEDAKWELLEQRSDHDLAREIRAKWHGDLKAPATAELPSEKSSAFRNAIADARRSERRRRASRK